MRRGFILPALWAATLAVPAVASDKAIFSDEARWVEDEDLAAQRGGFRWQGVDIELGAELRSYVSDSLVAQTNVSWTNGQANLDHVVADGYLAMSPAELTGILSGNGLGAPLGHGTAYLSRDSQTAFIQRADAGLLNIVLNSASNIAIRQEIDATISLGNFGQFQAGMRLGNIGDSLGAIVGLAGIAK